MKNALILYNTRTGTTARFASEIAEIFESNRIRTKVCSIFDYEPSEIPLSDYVLLGCWTNGLMLFYQHPDRVWVEFSRQLPDLSGKKVGLFTTYLLATGSMFKKMEEHIRTDTGTIELKLRSRNGTLKDSDRKDLLRFIGDNGNA